jgi:hypothetical protein
MKELILNKTQANLIQVALTHTYEEFLFLTPNQKDLLKDTINKLDSFYQKSFTFTNEEIIMITIGVSKWYQEYMDYDEDGDNMEDWKLSATQVMDKLLNINKGDVPTENRIYAVLNEDRGGDTDVTLHRSYKSAKKMFDQIVKELKEIRDDRDIDLENIAYSWDLSEKHLGYDLGDNWGNIMIFEEKKWKKI